MCGSRKYQYPWPPHGRSLKIPRVGGGGGLNDKIYRGKYAAKLEIPGGRKGSSEKPSMGEAGYKLGSSGPIAWA